MKKILIAVLLITGFGSSAMAQNEKKGRGEFKNLTIEQRVEKQTERMTKSLQLTDDQKEAVYKLNLETAQAMKAENAKRREAMKAARQSKEEKLKALLSAEQMQKHEQLKAERKKKMQERKASGRNWKGNNSQKVNTAPHDQAKPVK